MAAQLQPLEVTLSEKQLREAGFVDSGVVRFEATVKDYSQMLFERAVRRGEVDKDPDVPREIAHDHVKKAAASIAVRPPPKSRWMVAAQIGEYIGTAIAGVGGGHLDKPVGIAAFGLGLTVVVVLVVIRLTTKQE